jgi:hypothetical protein
MVSPTSFFSRARVAALLAGAALVVSACGSAVALDDATPRATASVPATTPSSAPVAPPVEAPATDAGPEESFRAWLAASRAPDTDTACGYMTEALVQRMLDELAAGGFPGLTDCATLITTTAQMYAAVGQSAEVDIEVREQTADRAVLGVAYATGNSCGTAVMTPSAGRWVITENSEEEC